MQRCTGIGCQTIALSLFFCSSVNTIVVVKVLAITKITTPESIVILPPRRITPAELKIKGEPQQSNMIIRQCGFSGPDKIIHDAEIFKFRGLVGFNSSR